MPRVPSYGNTQVQDASLPGVRLTAAPTAASMGAPIGAGLQDLAQASDQIHDQRTRIVLEERAKAERTALLDGDRQLGEWENRALHDAKAGALTKRGSEALALPEPVLADYDTTVGKIEQGLVGDRVKKAFRQQAGERRVGVDRTLQRHVAAEGEAYRQASFKAYVETSHTAALAAAGDPTRVDLEISRQEAAIAENLRGQPPEVVERVAKETYSRTYAGVVGRLLDNGQAEQARTEFERTKGNILPQDADAITKALAVAGNRRDSQRMVDELLAAKTEDGSALPLDVALAKVAERTADRPELRQEAEQRLVTMHSLRERADRERDEGNYRKAYDAFASPNNARGLDAIPETVMAKLRPEHQEQLRSYAASRDRGQPIATDWGAYYALRQQAASETSKPAFLQSNLLEYRTKLADAQFKELVDLQADLRSTGGKGGEGSQKLLAGVTSAEDAAKEALVGAGINPDTSVSNKDAARAIAFRRQLDRRIVAVQQQTGKPVNGDDVRKLADDLLVKQVIRQKRSGWSPMRLVDDAYDEVGERFAFESPGADRLAYSPRDVPASERAKIAAALREAGHTVSDEAVLDLYNRQVERTSAE